MRWTKAVKKSEKRKCRGGRLNFATSSEAKKKNKKNPDGTMGGRRRLGRKIPIDSLRRQRLSLEMERATLQIQQSEKTEDQAEVFWMVKPSSWGASNHNGTAEKTGSTSKKVRGDEVTGAHTAKRRKNIGEKGQGMRQRTSAE